MPGCKSNYKSADASAFSFPKDEQRRQQWMRAIHRKDFTPTENTIVCSKHFEKRFIITEDSMTRADGTVVTAKRGRPSLHKDACPTIFENQPKYMSKEIPAPRTTPQERRDKLIERDEVVFSDWIKKDQINSFKEFCEGFTEKLSKGWLHLSSDDYVSFLRINCDGQPKLTVSFKVMSDLTVSVWLENNTLKPRKLKWLLGEANACDLWSKFENLLSHLNLESASTLTVTDKLTQCKETIEEILETDNDEMSSKKKVMWFCAEQLGLICKDSMKYSCDFLVWSYSVFMTNPSLYTSLRDSGVLVLPHPNYLRKLSISTGAKCLNTENSHELFLKETFSSLKSEEKLVNVLLDEIHVKKGLSYKGGKIYGASVNSDEPATTIQAFMISSLLSKHKHVAALYPVCKLTADTLLDLTHKVLAFLHDIGYKVVSLIADNNRVNRKMFEKLCDGPLTPSISNPYDSSEQLFLLFDSVHLLKCIRNNWLNQKKPIQTFVIPSPSNLTIQEEASLQPLKELYAKERKKCVKLAPGLSEKVLFPNNLERQNVQLVVRLFDEKNVAALKTMNLPGVSGTAAFLQQIMSWWHIVNVKTPDKGVALRQAQCDPIRQDSSTDPNLLFLTTFVQWLAAWEGMELVQHERIGQLSRETAFALKHTTATLVKLCDYLLKDHDFRYVLLGKFQTDKLEGRFGQYRKMSGANYNVAVAQVMESERKIKVINVLSMGSSKFGPLTLTELNHSQLESQSHSESVDCLEKFKGVEKYVKEQSLSKQDESVMMYIAGYVAHVVRKRLKCDLCVSRISLDKVMEAEIPEECQYLHSLDRGGLKWPTDFTLSVCIHTYQIFQALLNNFKTEFIQCTSNQRLALVRLSLNFQGTLVDVEECCPCNTSVSQLLRMCIWPVTNILLNNFKKSYNDTVGRKDDKKRKLSTLKES